MEDKSRRKKPRKEEKILMKLCANDERRVGLLKYILFFLIYCSLFKSTGSPQQLEPLSDEVIK